MNAQHKNTILKWFLIPPTTKDIFDIIFFRFLISTIIVTTLVLTGLSALIGCSTTTTGQVTSKSGTSLDTSKMQVIESNAVLNHEINPINTNGNSNQNSGMRINQNNSTNINKNTYVKSTYIADPSNNDKTYSAILKRQSHGINVNVAEYLNRIGKKLILVSRNPQAEYLFKITEDGKQISLEPPRIISLNRNSLKTLHNEAQLAYILSAAINKLNRKGASVSSLQEDIDNLNLMSRAGYDPNAVLELQEQCLYSGTCEKSLISKVSEHKIDAERIRNARSAVKAAPKGLQTYKDRFLNVISNS